MELFNSSHKKLNGHVIVLHFLSSIGIKLDVDFGGHIIREFKELFASGVAEVVGISELGLQALFL